MSDEREILARRDGLCQWCSAPIFAGEDAIAPDAQDRWLHAKCAKRADANAAIQAEEAREDD